MTSWNLKSIVVNPSGMRETFLDPVLGEILEEKCKEKEKELNAACAPYVHGRKRTGPNTWEPAPISGSLFESSAKKLDNTYVGRIIPKNQTLPSGQKTNIAAAINSKHKVIRW